MRAVIGLNVLNRMRGPLCMERAVFSYVGCKFLLFPTYTFHPVSIHLIMRHPVREPRIPTQAELHLLSAGLKTGWVKKVPCSQHT